MAIDILLYRLALKTGLNRIEQEIQYNIVIFRGNEFSKRYLNIGLGNFTIDRDLRYQGIQGIRKSTLESDTQVSLKN